MIAFHFSDTCLVMKAKTKTRKSSKQIDEVFGTDGEPENENEPDQDSKEENEEMKNEKADAKEEEKTMVRKRGYDSPLF